MTDQEREATGTPTTWTTADPKPAAIAMMVGNVIGAVGLILGFVRLSAGGAEAIKPVALPSAYSASSRPCGTRSCTPRTRHG